MGSGRPFWLYLIKSSSIRLIRFYPSRTSDFVLDHNQNQLPHPLNELENRLEVFYEKYNHTRIHSGTAHLPPHIFWQCWEKNLIGRKVIANRKIRFNLTIPYQNLSGNESQREVLCSNEKSLDGADHLHIKEVNGATTSNNHRSNDHRRSSFASSKLNTNVIFTET